MQVVSYYFCCYFLTTLLFLYQKLCCTSVFCIVFRCFFRKNRKKYDNFLQFLLAVYQLVTKNLKKYLLKSLDKILKCCIFAALLNIKQINNKKQ